MSARDNPYFASKKAKINEPWYDSFAKGGRVVWIIHWGDQFLAEVKNEQQAINIMSKFNDLLAKDA
jgi:hypothetical protein